jgi:hypothetical protein
MTRLARRASLLVALSLLTSTATADAECAWVLWGRVALEFPTGVWSDSFDDIQRSIWAPRSSYETRKECELGAKDQRAVLAAILKEHPLSPGHRMDPATGKRSPDDRLPVPTLYVRCLPDTVDPRGRK